MKAFCFAIFALLIGGCASVEWTKPGATPEELAFDAQQCQGVAWREANWSYLDRSYPFGGRWVYPDPLRRPFAGYPYAAFGDPFGERYMIETRLADFCMRSRGYDLTQVAK